MGVQTTKTVLPGHEFGENGLLFRREECITPGFFQHSPVLVHLAGIMLQILGIIELQGVDENAAGYFGVQCFGPTHEVQMALVQGPHRGNETNGGPVLAGFGGPFCNG